MVKLKCYYVRLYNCTFSPIQQSTLNFLIKHNSIIPYNNGYLSPDPKIPLLHEKFVETSVELNAVQIEILRTKGVLNRGH